MRALLDHPSIQLGLRVLDGGKDLAGEELAPQRLVSPFDLARRGRRSWRGQEVLSAVLPADPVEQHLPRPQPEAAREHLAVNRQDLPGNHTHACVGGRPSALTPDKLAVARQMHASRQHTMEAIAEVVGVSRATLYRHLDNTQAPPAKPTGRSKKPAKKT